MSKKNIYKGLSALLSVLLIVSCGYIIELSDGTPIERQQTEAKLQAPEVIFNTDDDKKNKDTVKININTASVNELCTLKGIGGAIAGRIVKYREEHGKFISVEDLLGVNGIGEKKMDAIRDFICVE